MTTLKTTFSDGDVFYSGITSDTDKLNGITNEINNKLPAYAVLYNRMESDYNALNQLASAPFQSDIFCDADGRYNTICTDCTTSSFNTNLYTNLSCVTCTPTYTISCCAFCACASSVTGCGTNTVCGLACGCNWPSFCGCARYTASGVINGLNNAHCVVATTTVCGCNRHTYQNYMASNTFNGDLACVTYSLSGSGSFCNCTCTKNYCFIRNGTCYDYYIGAGCVCNVANTYCFCNDIDLLAQVRCYDDCVADAKVVTSIKSYYSCNTSLQGIIKNYATPKNTVILSTVSTLPAGNCIRYNIYNQAGTLRLCDAILDAVYNLNCSDDCCFYAVINQCVACCLCSPQCITQYALMFM